MFVYSLRASTLRFFGVIAVSLAVLFVLITLVPTYAAESEQTAIAFASISIAIPQVAWDIASTVFLIIKSESWNIFL